MDSNIQLTAQERNYGIDILKILSMMMIAVLHVLGQGGVLNNLRVLSSSYNTAWFLETASFGAVNCFALASGFVQVRSKAKPSRLAELWLTAAYYTILITLIFSKSSPSLVTKKEWFYACLPVSTNQYWYFTSYFGMCFLIPFLNKGITALFYSTHSCTENNSDITPPDNKHSSLSKAIIVLTALFIVFTIIPLITRSDIFFTNNGYSLIWLTVLYIAGAILRTSGAAEKSNGFVCFMLYLFFTTAAWLSKLYILRHPLVIESENITSSTLIQYTSPLIALSSVSLMIAFSKIKIRFAVIQKIIIFLSSLAFSVYLIHVHPLVWNNILKNRFVSYARLNPHQLVIAVLCTAAAIWALCTLIDIPRALLFRLAKFCTQKKSRTEVRD